MKRRLAFTYYLTMFALNVAIAVAAPMDGNAGIGFLAVIVAFGFAFLLSGVVTPIVEHGRE